MKPVDAKSNTYIDSSKEINHKNPKFKIVDIVMISKHFFSFVKGYSRNLSKEFFVIKKLKILCYGHILLVILTEKKLLELFTKKQLQKTNNK